MYNSEALGEDEDDEDDEDYEDEELTRLDYDSTIEKIDEVEAFKQVLGFL